MRYLRRRLYSSGLILGNVVSENGQDCLHMTLIYWLLFRRHLICTFIWNKIRVNLRCLVLVLKDWALFNNLIYFWEFRAGFLSQTIWSAWLFWFLLGLILNGYCRVMWDTDLLISHLMGDFYLLVDLFILTENSTVLMSFNWLIREALDSKNIRFQGLLLIRVVRSRR